MYEVILVHTIAGIKTRECDPVCLKETLPVFDFFPCSLNMTSRKSCFLSTKA